MSVTAAGLAEELWLAIARLLVAVDDTALFVEAGVGVAHSTLCHLFGVNSFSFLRHDSRWMKLLAGRRAVEGLPISTRSRPRRFRIGGSIAGVHACTWCLTHRESANTG